MKEVYVNLNQIEIVKDFVNTTAKFDKNEVDLDLVSSRYIVDATSILGIFSLDLSKKISLRINGKNEKIEQDVVNELKDFIIK